MVIIRDSQRPFLSLLGHFGALLIDLCVDQALINTV